MPISVRLDAKTTDVIERLARRTGRTKSQVVRAALLEFARREAVADRPRTAYEDIAHLIGCFDSTEKDLSERTGEKFAALVREKARARRSR